MFSTHLKTHFNVSNALILLFVLAFDLDQPKILSLTPDHTILNSNDPNKDGLKNKWEKEKKMVTRIFSLSHFVSIYPTLSNTYSIIPSTSKSMSANVLNFDWSKIQLYNKKLIRKESSFSNSIFKNCQQYGSKSYLSSPYKMAKF